jgi:hypothetical protein
VIESKLKSIPLVICKMKLNHEVLSLDQSEFMMQHLRNFLAQFFDQNVERDNKNADEDAANIELIRRVLPEEVEAFNRPITPPSPPP